MERLDFKAPPPGYKITVEYIDSEHPCMGGWDSWNWTLGSEKGSPGGWGYESAAIDAAWEHYKRRNDPPGMTSWRSEKGVAWGRDDLQPLGELEDPSPSRMAATWIQARADSWVRYLEQPE